MDKYTSIKLIAGAWFLFFAMLLVGCSDERIEGEPSNDKMVSLELNLNVPGAHISSGMAKSMGETEEKLIDNLQVLVFEETGGDEVFRYKAEITKREQLRLTVEAKVSHNDEKYRFVILANASAQTIADGTSKADALNKFTFDCAGVWNAQESNSKAIPMWGEYISTFEVKRERYINILMHRALARVDVGLDFVFDEDGYPTEETRGLDNFKIKDIRVYRTKNKGYVATSSDKMNANNEVVDPNIPTDAKFNLHNGTSTDDISEADKSPLFYQLTVADSKYIREIYIPESFDATGEPSMDDVPCLVVGGYYGKDNTSKLSYYRADFAVYEGVKPTKYFSVLRNHRYVFNIKNVTNAGFPDEEKALNSLPVNLVLEVSEWNEKPMNFYVQGNYYFGLEDREVWLKAEYPIYGGEQYGILGTIIPFETNLNFREDSSQGSSGAGEIVVYENFKLEWESSGTNISKDKEGGDLFAAYVILQDIQPDPGPFIPANSIVIQTESENVGRNGVLAEERSDILNVTVENFKFTIKVTQKATNIEFDLLCSQTVVHGKYREGVPLNYTHFLEVQIVSRDDLFTNQAEVKIVSETRKGIQFGFEGKLEKQGIYQTDGTYLYTVKLQGKGTPTKDMNDPLNPDKADGILTRIDDLLITTNSVNGSFCQETDIIFGYKTKKILAIGANAMYRYGYMLEPNTGSRAFVDASINFGVDPNSTVTMEQFPDDYRHLGNYENKSDVSARGNAFHIEYMTAGRGMSGESINETYLNTMLREFKPDIILTGQAINFSDNAIDAIANFVKEGGVMLMFNEYYPRAESINKMAGAIIGTSLSGANEALTTDKFVFTLPSGNQYKDDPILNNSFGDLRGKKWGTDGYFLHGFSGLPSNDIVVYSKRPAAGDPCFFRYETKTKSFVFVGDGGFISNAQRYIGPTYQGMFDYCPFAISSAYQPIARTNFLRGTYGDVDNSKLFGNILLWAVDRAEFYGINAKK